MAKKIMFNDKYSLTQAVLEGWKTTTRRIVTDKKLHYWKCSCPDMVIVKVPDELTDAVIRLLDLCGLREIKLENDCLDDEVLEEYSHIFIGKTFTESIFNITKNLIDRDISYSLIKIFGLAKHLDIDLLWHIEQKQRYNELIPYKHGKKY